MKKWLTLSFLIILSTACSTTHSTVSVNSGTREIGRSERFVAYDNGTVKDLTTGLMWAATDNGGPIGWDEAKTLLCGLSRRRLYRLANALHRGVNRHL